jgi:hypothetical protein
MTLKNVVSMIAIGATVDAAGAPTAATAKKPIAEHAPPEKTGSPTVDPLPVSRAVSVMPRRANDLMAGVILTIWDAACWCARIPRNFEEQREWMNR